MTVNVVLGQFQMVMGHWSTKCLCLPKYCDLCEMLVANTVKQVCGHTCLSKSIPQHCVKCSAHKRLVFWRRLLFLVPSGELF